ncbi:TIR-NBS-LRR RCT1 resistance protein, partial [Trifolium medium]|nr:TIR-NBS-LRR RCT1 resistance protein [Trifolium medium]
DVVEYCGGLPLALEVIGSFLFGRSVAEYKSVLEKLKIIPNDMIMRKLRTNFNDLDDYGEKPIFLSVATLFIGMDKDDVIHTLNDSRFLDIGITFLEEKSLVTIDSKNRIVMHTLLQALGREIIRQQSGDMTQVC